MKTLKNIFILSIVLSLNISYAENWVSVDGEEIYVDTDSKKIKGDLITLALKNNSSIIDIEIDCKKMKYRFPRHKFEDLKSGTFAENIYKVACKRTWEFWK